MTVLLDNMPDVISEVLEELALMFVHPPQDEHELNRQIAGWIEFDGPVRGRLSAQCSRTLARLLASNLLGTEPDDPQTEEKTCDAFAEMLNVTAGNLVTKLFGSQQTFSLCPPVCVALDDETQDPPTTPDDETCALRKSCLLLLENEPIEFTLSITKTTAPTGCQGV